MSSRCGVIGRVHIFRLGQAQLSSIKRHSTQQTDDAVAGYLIKVDSKGKCDPAKYGRAHAAGFNMFSDVLAPYGIIMWSALVYGDVAG